MSKINVPRNDEELKQLLQKLGRNQTQIDAIMDYGKLCKALENNDFESIKILENKWLREFEIHTNSTMTEGQLVEEFRKRGLLADEQS